MSLIKMAELDLSGKRVLIREDLNVPVADGVVTSEVRIRAALPTIKDAIEAHAAVMLMSHLGRPIEGNPGDEFTLQPVADCLARLLQCDVPLVKDWIDGIEIAAGDVVLLENVRFLPGEKACDESLAIKMASLCEVFVMAAFGTAHRAHPSTWCRAAHAPHAAAGPVLRPRARTSGLTRPPAEGPSLLKPAISFFEFTAPQVSTCSASAGACRLHVAGSSSWPALPAAVQHTTPLPVAMFTAIVDTAVSPS